MPIEPTLRQGSLERCNTLPLVVNPNNSDGRAASEARGKRKRPQQPHSRRASARVQPTRRRNTPRHPSQGHSYPVFTHPPAQQRDRWFQRSVQQPARQQQQPRSLSSLALLRPVTSPRIPLPTTLIRTGRPVLLQALPAALQICDCLLYCSVWRLLSPSKHSPWNMVIPLSAEHSRPGRRRGGWAKDPAPRAPLGP